MVRSAIVKETEIVCDELRTSSNPGKFWKGWKARIKLQLQDVQKSFDCKSLELSPMPESR